MIAKDCVTCEYRMIAAMQQPCDTCLILSWQKTSSMSYELDRSKVTEYANWKPCELYAAYIQMKAHADLARKRYEEEKERANKLQITLNKQKIKTLGAKRRAERFRQALNCRECAGSGSSPAHKLVVCPSCAETRKEAANND